jgi:hypothetical protein
MEIDMTNFTAAEKAAAADAYAALKFEEAEIKARVEEAKADVVLKAGNDKELVGDTIIVSLVAKKGAETFDKAAAIALLESLGATPEQIAKLKGVGKPTTAITLKPKLALAI